MALVRPAVFFFPDIGLGLLLFERCLNSTRTKTKKKGWASQDPQQGPNLAQKLPAWGLRVFSSGMIGAISGIRGIITVLSIQPWHRGPFKPKRVHPRPERTSDKC